MNRKTIRVVFLYPPSKSYAEDPDGWWSWPGNEFDAEVRQEKYRHGPGRSFRGYRRAGVHFIMSL